MAELAPLKLEVPGSREFVEADKAAGLAIIRTLARELCQRLRHDSETMLRRADEMRSKFLDMDY